MFNFKKTEYTPLDPKPKSGLTDTQCILILAVSAIAFFGLLTFILLEWAAYQDAIDEPIIERERMMKEIKRNFTNLIEPTGLKLMELQLLDVLDNKPEAFKHMENEYQDYVKDQIEYFTKMIEMLKLNGEKLKTMDSWPAMKNVAKADVFAWFSRCHMFEEDMQNICFQQCKDLFPKLK